MIRIKLVDHNLASLGEARLPVIPQVGSYIQTADGALRRVNNVMYALDESSDLSAVYLSLGRDELSS